MTLDSEQANNAYKHAKQAKVALALMPTPDGGWEVKQEVGFDVAPSGAIVDGFCCLALAALNNVKMICDTTECADYKYVLAQLMKEAANDEGLGQRKDEGMTLRWMQNED